MTRILKITLITVLVSSALVVMAIAGFAYLRTGKYLYSSENLAECQKFSVDEVKEAVLRSRLRNYNNLLSHEEFSKEAKKSGIVFFEAEIKKSSSGWLVPFTQPNNMGVKRFYAILDCGTQTVEYSSEAWPA